MSNTITKEVSLGHRKVSKEPVMDHLTKCLENGRALKESNAYPINCQAILYDYTPQRKNPTQPHPWMDFYHAVIPKDGICSDGYVKEVWIEYFINSEEIDGQCYNVICPYVHDPDIVIGHFEVNGMDGDPSLLPSPEIVVKYYEVNSEH